MLETWQQNFGSALSSRGERFIGQLIDGVVTLCLYFGGILLLGALSDSEPGGLAIFLGFAPGIAYYFLADALPGGQSLGKKMLGMRVIDMESGEPCGLGQSFIRNLILFVAGPIDWVFIFGERHQRLGDKAAGTLVVNEALRSPPRL